MDETGSSGPAPDEELAQLLRALWRAVARATREVEHLPTLAEAKAFLLRKLVSAGPLSPAQLAAELDLARPTVSNLVRELDAEGLLERRPSPVDGRSVLLVPTERARHVLEAFGRGRIEVVERAMAKLSAQDHGLLVAAVPSLRRLLEHLQTTTEDGRAEPAAGAGVTGGPSGPRATGVPP
jgi:DNA-binding MarR family transcriptional regulator